MSSRNVWFLVAIILLIVVKAPAPKKMPFFKIKAYSDAMSAYFGEGNFEFLSHTKQAEEEAKSLKKGKAAFEKEYVGEGKVLGGDYIVLNIGTTTTQGFAVHKSGAVKPLFIKNAQTFGTETDNTDTAVGNFLNHLFVSRKTEYGDPLALTVPTVIMNAAGFAVPAIRGKEVVKNEPLLKIGGKAAETIDNKFAETDSAGKLTYGPSAKLVYQIAKTEKEKSSIMPLFVKARAAPKFDIVWGQELANRLSAGKYIGEIGGSSTRKIFGHKFTSSDKDLRKPGKMPSSEYVNALYEKCEDTVPAAEKLADTVIAQMQGVLADAMAKAAAAAAGGEKTEKEKAEAAAKAVADLKEFAKSVMVYQTGSMRNDAAAAEAKAEAATAAKAKTRETIKKHITDKIKAKPATVKASEAAITKEAKAEKAKVRDTISKHITDKAEKEAKAASARQEHFNFFSELGDFDAYDDDAYKYDEDGAYELDDFYYDAYEYNDDDAYKYDDDAYNNEEYGSYEPDDDKEVSPGDVNGYRYYAEPRAEASQSGYYMDDNIKFAAVVFSAFALMVCCVVSFVCAVCGVIFGFKMQKKSMEKEAAYSNVNVSDNSELI